MHANRLVPILSIAFVAVIMLVLVRGCDTDNTTVVPDAVPIAPAPDADTPADTIRTLTANVAAMTAELKSLRRDNDALLKDNQRLTALGRDTQGTVDRRIADALKARDESDSEMLREQATRFEALTNRFEALSHELALEDERAGELPVGFGLIPGEDASDAWHWITPVDRVNSGDSAEPTSKRLRPSDRSPAPGQQQAPIWPVYTVPRNATLLDATALTALVGRVPRDGQVQDPMPFKVITGSDNLASNGLRLPGVSGMIWSGTAFGDWTLGCVTGRLHSVTFVFDDGTVRTVSSDTRQPFDDGANDNRPLGWISDDRGIPCVAGSRKTNAPQYLSQRIAVRAAEAGATAAAAAETTSIVGSGGTVTDRVSGDIGEFVLGKSIAGGAEEVADWLQKRQAQNFDAVFVAAGEGIALHVDRQIAIDYEPLGRRLSHESRDNRMPYVELD